MGIREAALEPDDKKENNFDPEWHGEKFSCGYPKYSSEGYSPRGEEYKLDPPPDPDIIKIVMSFPNKEINESNKAIKKTEIEALKRLSKFKPDVHKDYKINVSSSEYVDEIEVEITLTPKKK